MVNYRITYTPKDGRGYNPRQRWRGTVFPEMFTYFDNSPYGKIHNEVGTPEWARLQTSPAEIAGFRLHRPPKCLFISRFYHYQSSTTSNACIRSSAKTRVSCRNSQNPSTHNVSPESRLFGIFRSRSGTTTRVIHFLARGFL